MRCAVPGPSLRSCLLVIWTFGAITAWTPREIHPTIIIESDTDQFNFGLEVVAAGPLLAVEDLVRVDHDTAFQIRIGRVRDGSWHEEARVPVGGWLHGMAMSGDTFAWRAGAEGAVRFARFANGRWMLAETVNVDDERCRYVPDLGENIFLEDNVLVVNGATNVCVFEQRARAWTLAKVVAKSVRRELVVYAGGRVITAVVGERTAVVHARAQRGWVRSEIALPFRTGWEDIAASRHWLVLPTEADHELYVLDLERGGKLAAHLAPTDRSPSFGANFAVNDTRLVVDDRYSRPYVYVVSRDRWELDARLKATDSARVVLGDHAWVTQNRFGSEEPGRIAGFELE